MPVTIVGDYPLIERVRTGLFSYDLALSSRGELGHPMRTMTEIYGYPNVGKSTLSYYLAAAVSRNKRIAICDLEFVDRDYLSRTLESYGFDGEVKLINITDEKRKPISHEKMLMDMAKTLLEEDTGSSILDSIGAIQPIAEAEGDFGEAFMGKRAKLVAQVSRAIGNALRVKESPSCAFVVNHVHSIIGGRGHSTAGGETLKFLSAQRIMLHTAKVYPEGGDEPPYGFLVEGHVEKLRYGGRGKSFQFYIVPGYGIHLGATAMFDCLELGVAERGTKIKIDGKSIGYLQADFLSFAADGSKGKKFDVFDDALAEYEHNIGKKLKVEEKDGEDEPDESGEDKPVETRKNRKRKSGKR